MDMTFPSIISSKQSLITIMLSVICWCKKCKCDIFAVFLPLLKNGRLEKYNFWPDVIYMLRHVFNPLKFSGKS